MAYPTGSGSERIRTGAIHNQINADTSFKFDGTNPATGTQTYAVPANHIITILTIVFSDQSNSNKLFQLIYCITLLLGHIKRIYGTKNWYCTLLTNL